MSSAEIEVAVIGAGVIGLAIAREIALQGREVIVLESEHSIGFHTSSRNSEVIHAGIYYPKNSLKARFCVEGKELLYNYCDSHKVDYKKCGKYIVATDKKQLQQLDDIKSKAQHNGVNDLEFISAKHLKSIEPAIKAYGALFSPSTGIIDSHAYLLSLQGDIERNGGSVVLCSTVTGGEIGKNQHTLDIKDKHGECFHLKADIVINSAGLRASDVARSITGMPSHLIPETHLAKGNYFKLQCKSPFSHLIYPIPEQAGLGIHATLDLNGQLRFGPDVEWVDNINYQIDNDRSLQFYDAIRRYWPNLEDNKLTADYSGIRPKTHKPGEPANDFLIQGKDELGVTGWINLFGIESPGLTASLAIAKYVRLLLTED